MSERKREREGDWEWADILLLLCSLSALPRAIHHYQPQAAETFHVTSNVAGVLQSGRKGGRERERGG